MMHTVLYLHFVVWFIKKYTNLLHLIAMTSVDHAKAYEFYYCATSPSGPGPPDYQGFTITLRHTCLCTTSLDEWSSWRRDLYLKKTRYLQEMYFDAPGGIRTLSTSERAAADPRLRPCGHWDRQNIPIASRKYSNCHLLILTISSGSCLVWTILFRNTDIDTGQWKLSDTLCPIYLRKRASGVSKNSTKGSIFGGEKDSHP